MNKCIFCLNLVKMKKMGVVDVDVNLNLELYLKVVIEGFSENYN